MQTMIDITGTTDQRAKFAKRIKQPIERIAADVLEEMGFPDLPIQFKVVLRGTAKDVQEHYRGDHTGPFNSVAYATGSTIYISVADASARVIAHEMAHAVLNTYFTDPVPTILHELIACAVEEKVCKRYARWFW